jgi:acyl-CoA thioester hydrolase
MLMEATADVSEITHRVNYSETDQMGVVYYARYLVWLEIARTEHLRRAGTSYAELERQGLRLAVGEVYVRYVEPARYDQLVRVRCWVRELGSRRILFEYAIVDDATGRVLASATTSLMVLNAAFRWTRLPPEVASRLAPPGGAASRARQ